MMQRDITIMSDWPNNDGPSGRYLVIDSNNPDTPYETDKIDSKVNFGDLVWLQYPHSFIANRLGKGCYLCTRVGLYEIIAYQRLRDNLDEVARLSNQNVQTLRKFL